MGNLVHSDLLNIAEGLSSQGSLLSTSDCARVGAQQGGVETNAECCLYARIQAQNAQLAVQL